MPAPRLLRHDGTQFAPHRHRLRTRRHFARHGCHSSPGSRLIPAAIQAGIRGGVAPDEGELLDTGTIPGGGELRLVRFGTDFSIQVGRDELMGSDLSGSEKALATATCRRLARGASRVLIGGLGMGFTLGAARAALPPGVEIVVAELVPAVAAWARGPLAHLFGDHLDDPRVSIRIGDVHDVIDAAHEAFDAIMLDVDNGPDGLVQAANERLYCNWGLRAAYAALRPAGVLAIWSAYGDDAFVARLKAAGFAVEEINVRAHEDRTGDRHTIWLAFKPAA